MSEKFKEEEFEVMMWHFVGIGGGCLIGASIQYPVYSLPFWVMTIIGSIMAFVSFWRAYIILKRVLKRNNKTN